MKFIIVIAAAFIISCQDRKPVEDKKEVLEDVTYEDTGKILRLVFDTSRVNFTYWSQNDSIIVKLNPVLHTKLPDSVLPGKLHLMTPKELKRAKIKHFLWFRNFDWTYKAVFVSYQCYPFGRYYAIIEKKDGKLYKRHEEFREDLYYNGHSSEEMYFKYDSPEVVPYWK